MISAAVKGLARLSYGYSEIIQCASIHIPLATEEIREITEVLVAKSQADGLQMRLKSMVEGLLKWQDSTKSHFTAKKGDPPSLFVNDGSFMERFKKLQHEF